MEALNELLKEENILVFTYPFKTDNIIGYIEYNDVLKDIYPDTPVMILNANLQNEEKRYIKAVLLGCYKSYFDDEEISFDFLVTDYNLIDEDILLFARELLIPYEKIGPKRKLKDDIFNNTIRLAKKFGVPKNVAFERIKDFC